MDYQDYKPLKLPSFLNEDVEEIHERMLGAAPQDISTVEGDIYWDNTRPTAEAKARLLNMVLPEVLALAFPQYAYGEYLELHGEQTDTERHQPTYATGKLIIEGEPETVIPPQFIVYTVSIDDKEPVGFRINTELSQTIPENGRLEVPLKAIDEGRGSNVAANTVTVLSRSIRGVKKIYNPDPIRNGTEAESDESFRQRILFNWRYPALSGAKRDYIRWAREVDGVGNAYCLPEWDGAGTVKLLIIDSNGEPANEDLLEAVRLYILKQKTDGKNTDGLVPIGAFLTVTTPDILKLNISLDMVLEKGVAVEDIEEDLTNRINDYIYSLDIDDTIVFKAIEGIVGSLIIENKAVIDYSNLLLNGDTKNIKLNDEVPQLEKVIINV